MSDTAYEMWWDCPYCGTRGLLGLSHRHCPKCGAPQDPARRYFPPQGQEVEARDHVYAGADRNCPACDSPCSAKARHCANCGSPLDEAREVARVSAVEPGPAPRQSPPAPAKPAAGSPSRGSSRAVRWGLALLMVLIGSCVGLRVWKKDVTVEVVDRTWERSIAIETLSAIGHDTWCDEMPQDAYQVRRDRRVRSHRKVEDGQECRTTNVDQGDGSFRKEERCTTRYREEPVHDEHCSYTVDRWTKTREVAGRGSGQDAPAWPVAQLARTGTTRGSEREGPRTAAYVVKLRGPSGRYECKVSESAWSSYRTGEKLRLKVRVVTGGADCSSLPRR